MRGHELESHLALLSVINERVDADVDGLLRAGRAFALDAVDRGLVVDKHGELDRFAAWSEDFVDKQRNLLNMKQPIVEGDELGGCA